MLSSQTLLRPGVTQGLIISLLAAAAVRELATLASLALSGHSKSEFKSDVGNSWNCRDGPALPSPVGGGSHATERWKISMNICTDHYLPHQNSDGRVR